MADLNELFAALSDLASAPGGAKATSVRQPEATGGSSSRRRSAQRLVASRRRTAADANRLVQHDDPLDREGGDRVVELRRAVPSASVVDACVAVAAERVWAPLLLSAERGAGTAIARRAGRLSRSTP